MDLLAEREHNGADYFSKFDAVRLNSAPKFWPEDEFRPPVIKTY